MVFNLTATGGGVVDGNRSVTGRFVAAFTDVTGRIVEAITDGVPLVGFTLGYDGRAVVNEFELTKLDEVIKGGK